MVVRCRPGTVTNSELGTAPDQRRIVHFAHAAPRPGHVDRFAPPPRFNCQTAACFPSPIGRGCPSAARAGEGWVLTRGHNPSPAHARYRSACAPSPFGRGKRGCFTARRITIQLSNSQASSPCFFAAPGTPSFVFFAPGKEPRARGTPGVLRTHGPRRLATSRLVESCSAASPPNPKASRARCL